jgi:phospholipase/carboxylesterase
MTSLSFQHRFESAQVTNAPALLLLHGTGGDETDLLPLGRAVAPGAALLSPRGKVLEGGMPRFFRRLAEGVFDEDDVRVRAAELADFITQARAAYALPPLIALGFSNGANIAAAVLLTHPDALAGAALLRAMPPFAQPPAADLTGKRVLLISGAKDPIISPERAAHLATELSAAGAAVEHRSLAGGHGLSGSEVSLTKAWLAGFGDAPESTERVRH